jgi:hypothetical protein
MNASGSFRSFMVLWLAGLCLLSCEGKPPPIQQTETFISPMLTAKTATFTFIPTFIPTSANPKLTETLSSSPTITPTSSISYKPKPTLSDTQKSDLIVKLIQTYQGCQLPCWWGIEPGKDTVYLARQQLESLGFVNPTDYGVGGSLVGEFESINFGSGWGQNEGLVKQIFVESNILGDSSLFKKLWRSYSPEKIFEAYGQPTRIWITLYPNIMGTKIYFFSFFYDDRGILISYYRVVGSEDVNLCPSFATLGDKIGSIYMWLQSADDKTPLEDLVGEKIGPKSYIQPIEDVTGLSVATIYQQVLQQKENFCFKVSADKWP